MPSELEIQTIESKCAESIGMSLQMSNRKNKYINNWILNKTIVEIVSKSLLCVNSNDNKIANFILPYAKVMLIIVNITLNDHKLLKR